MSEVADKATEIVAEVADEVADQATQVAVASRGMSSRDLGLVFGGIVVGAGLGTTLGFIFSRRMLETKYNQLAEEEIEEMRQHYQDKMLAYEAVSQKPELEEIIKEQGYRVTPPMAVTPPAAVVEAVEEALREDEEEIEDAELVDEEPEVRNIFREAEKIDPEELEDDWDIHRERTRRSPTKPYVIHRDERDERSTYIETTFTYYAEDDVLCNERDEVLDRDERNQLIGEANLNRFGHGSGDPSIVYIRNDHLELDFEVVLSPNSYAEEVHGLKHSDTGRRRRERQSYDDE